MTLTATQQAKVTADLAAVQAEIAAFEQANAAAAAHEETQQENYDRAESTRTPGGSLPDGLAITEIVNGERQVVIKSRSNALRQIQGGVSRYVGRYVKE